ncbi:MAG: glutamine-hydrolyzing carbamoyl-phosphate synthase small subunit, partial [bacterium]|nr:glutamine-hydrolyzing carbamoyl-phosphate synthase small subunit [bacterium]
MTTRGRLLLADGTLFEGISFGAEGVSVGEVVFNTSLTGYQEILHDPSYCRQIVTMTCPEIGNVGVNPEDIESRKVQVAGFVVKEYQDCPSNFRSRTSLGSFLKENNIVAISGIDTRALTRKIRDGGAMMGILSTDASLTQQQLLRQLKKEPGMEGANLVTEVSCRKPYTWTEGEWKLGEGYVGAGFPRPGAETAPLRVIAYDFGIKFNILRGLVNAGCAVTVVPFNTPAEEVLRQKPDGVFLSNGPGDPAAVTESIAIVQNLLGKIPIFGICLGHQILSLALGGKTFKLKFGHRGGNQPVKDLTTGKVEITSQNHGFAVDEKSLKGKAAVTHINLNDKTVEGLRHKEWPIFSVQYHPEASPGPHDSHYLFKRF